MKYNTSWLTYLIQTEYFREGFHTYHNRFLQYHVQAFKSLPLECIPLEDARLKIGSMRKWNALRFQVLFVHWSWMSTSYADSMCKNKEVKGVSSFVEPQAFSHTLSVRQTKICLGVNIPRNKGLQCCGYTCHLECYSSPVLLSHKQKLWSHKLLLPFW